MAKNLAQTQQEFVQAIREKDSSNHDPRRLNIYVRLLRNNTFGFIEKCFTETPAHLNRQDWDNAKEEFVKNGKAHSPYFQDIAGEFLQFCQHKNIFDENILSLMQFEFDQLQAEVSMFQVPATFDITEKTPMKCSEVCFIREYPVDFLSTQFSKILNQPSKTIIWRNAQFEVYYQKLTDLDHFLLMLLQEKAYSLQELKESLKNLAIDDEILKFLQQIWYKWIELDVIIPEQSKE
ncbi:HvfC family RiPP maturation protein [Histophilus somni]|uniref:HvfC family RiPP maturation protein n=1 Tax=Histophilus somni TaxID=731 RepID=UPI00201EDC25|nr:putative DNA-binding domain-containing protein [Histophilus somni]